MTIRKRMLLWDWTNSTGAGSTPQNLAKVPYDASHPTVSLCNWNAWVIYLFRLLILLLYSTTPFRETSNDVH